MDRASTERITHLGVLLNRDVDLVGERHGGSHGIWQGERLLGTAIDVEQVRPHLVDLWNKKNKNAT